MNDAVLHRIYLFAYDGWEAPRWMRRRMARTDFHRAWLCGYHGWFEEAGVKYGPANPYPPADQEAVDLDDWPETLTRYGLPPG
ncbi:hypothetical protein O4H61_16675 [Roseovarius aestuarii]|nr:hypothetical protein [Roseovarius aestuarii]